MGKRIPTPTAADFMTANDRALVVAGAVVGLGGQGAIYTLANGDEFRLKAEDIRSLPSKYPIWALPS